MSFKNLLKKGLTGAKKYVQETEQRQEKRRSKEIEKLKKDIEKAKLEKSLYKERAGIKRYKPKPKSIPQKQMSRKQIYEIEKEIAAESDRKMFQREQREKAGLFGKKKPKKLNWNW